MISKNVYVVTYDARCSNKRLDETQKFVGVYGTMAQAYEAVDNMITEIVHHDGGPYPVQSGSNELALLWKSVVHPIMITDTIEETYYILKKSIKVI